MSKFQNNLDSMLRFLAPNMMFQHRPCIDKQTVDGHISVALIVKCIFALFSTARLSCLGRFQIRASQYNIGCQSIRTSGLYQNWCGTLMRKLGVTP